MHTWVARAFIRRMLSPDQVTDLRVLELQDKRWGRLLTGYEIVLRFHLKVKNPNDYEIQAMTMLHRTFEQKVLWKQQQIEDKNHGEICAGTPTDQWCKCKTAMEELHQWEDYAMHNYVKPKPPKETGDAGDDLVQPVRRTASMQREFA